MTFGSAAATNVVVVNSTTITATTPAGSGRASDGNGHGEWSEREPGQWVHLRRIADGEQCFTEQWCGGGWHGGNDYGYELRCGRDGDIWIGGGHERGGGEQHDDHGHDSGGHCRCRYGHGDGKRTEWKPDEWVHLRWAAYSDRCESEQRTGGGWHGGHDYGTNFASGATVTFGSAAATNVVVVSSTSITATTPAGSVGAVTVTVTNIGSQSGSLANGFTYNGTIAISFAQVASATPQSPTATVTVAYPAAQTAGDLNIVVVGWNDTTATVQSVRDSVGNTYSLAIGPTAERNYGNRSTMRRTFVGAATR